MLVDIAVPCVIPDSVNVPSFGSEWGFVVAMHLPEKESAARVAAEWIEPSRSMMDALIGKVSLVGPPPSIIMMASRT